jgi:hypothetical protein
MKTEARDHMRCVWREDEFLFLALRRAILPMIELVDILANWRNISFALREARRKRKRQLEYLARTLNSLS